MYFYLSSAFSLYDFRLQHPVYNFKLTIPLAQGYHLDLPIPWAPLSARLTLLIFYPCSSLISQRSSRLCLLPAAHQSPNRVLPTFQHLKLAAISSICLRFILQLLHIHIYIIYICACVSTVWHLSLFSLAVSFYCYIGIPAFCWHEHEQRHCFDTLDVLELNDVNCSLNLSSANQPHPKTPHPKP